MTLIKTPTGLVNTLDDDDRPALNVAHLADAAALGALGSTAAASPLPQPAPKVKAKPKAPKAAKAKLPTLPPASDQYLGRKAKVPKAKPAPKAVAPKPTGGGGRGAGRKPLDGKEAMHTVSFKCSEEQHETFRDIPGGGAAWIRWGLDQYREAKKAGKLL